MSYSFRIRVRVSRNSGLAIEEPVWSIGDDFGGSAVILTSEGRSAPIQNSESLIIRANGYETAEAAAAAVAVCRDVATRAFARLRVAVDFGDRGAGGGLMQSGRQVLNDGYGTMVFESGIPTAFASVSPPSIKMQARPEQLRKALKEAKKAPPLTEQEKVAYDLFSASFFESSPETRFLLLMMAVETLLAPAPRSEKARMHVEHLMHLTSSSSDLSRSQKQSLLGSLKWLLQESIGQAGRKLAKSLGDRRYMKLKPTEFFTICYDIRSDLVHGNVPRPTRNRVDAAAASLEVFVSDILAGPLRDIAI